MGARFVLAAIAVVCAVAGASQSVLHAQSIVDFRAPSTWTMFRGVPSGNAVLPGDLRVRWSVETQGAISSSPTVVGDTLYTDNNGGGLTPVRGRPRGGRLPYHEHNTPASPPPALGG